MKRPRPAGGGGGRGGGRGRGRGRGGRGGGETRTRFEELLQGTGGAAGSSDDAQLASLSKKMKLSGGKLADEGDGLDAFMDGLGEGGSGEDSGEGGEAFGGSFGGGTGGPDSSDELDGDDDYAAALAEVSRQERALRAGNGRATAGGSDPEPEDDSGDDYGAVDDEDGEGSSGSDRDDGMYGSEGDDGDPFGAGGVSSSDSEGDLDPESAEDDYDSDGDYPTEGADAPRDDGVRAEKQRVTEGAAPAKFVPRRVRESAAAAAAANDDAGAGGGARRGGGASSDVAVAMRRLLNRAAEQQLHPLAEEAARLLSRDRRSASAAAASAAVTSVSLTPKVSELLAGTLAALVSASAGAAGLVEPIAQTVAVASTRLLSAVDSGAEREASNVVLLLCGLYLCGAVHHSTMFGLVNALSARMSEAAVAALHALFGAAGGKLRAEDRVAFKGAILALQEGSARHARAGGSSKRLELMLQTVLSAKNGHARASGDGEIAAFVARQRTWLGSKGVDAVQLACPWEVVVHHGAMGAEQLAHSREDWWEDTHVAGSGSGEIRGVEAGRGRRLQSAGGDAAASGRGSGGGQAHDLLKLAQTARMNTGTRKAVFCCVMGAADATDAADKVTGLRLPSSQQKEVQRVVLECCLRERGFNRYYAHLAATLAKRERVHSVSLRTTLWDRLKALPSTDATQLVNLGAFAAHVMARDAAPATLLCPLADHYKGSSGKVELLLRAVMSTLLLSKYGAEQVAFWERVSTARELADVKDLMVISLRKALKAKGSEAFKDKGTRLLRILRS